MRHRRIVVAGYLLMGGWLVLTAGRRIAYDLGDGISVDPVTIVSGRPWRFLDFFKNLRIAFRSRALWQSFPAPRLRGRRRARGNAVPR